MDDQTAAELKRLEGYIRQNTGATRGLSEKVSSLSSRVELMESHRENDKDKDARAEKQIEALTKLLSDIKSEFDTFNGIITAIKWLGVVFGSLIIATILGAAGMLWNFNSDISILKTKIERIDKK